MDEAGRAAGFSRYDQFVGSVTTPPAHPRGLAAGTSVFTIDQVNLRESHGYMCPGFDQSGSHTSFNFYREVGIVYPNTRPIGVFGGESVDVVIGADSTLRPAPGGKTRVEFAASEQQNPCYGGVEFSDTRPDASDLASDTLSCLRDPFMHVLPVAQPRGDERLAISGTVEIECGESTVDAAGNSRSDMIKIAADLVGTSTPPDPLDLTADVLGGRFGQVVGTNGSPVV